MIVRSVPRAGILIIRNQHLKDIWPAPGWGFWPIILSQGWGVWIFFFFFKKMLKFPPHERPTPSPTPLGPHIDRCVTNREKRSRVKVGSTRGILHRNPQHPAENNGIAPTSQYPKFTIIYCVLRMLNQGEMRSTHIWLTGSPCS